MSDDEKKKTIEAALRDVSGASSEIDKARRSGRQGTAADPEGIPIER
jgi:hypothetical protein